MADNLIKIELVDMPVNLPALSVNGKLIFLEEPIPHEIKKCVDEFKRKRKKGIKIISTISSIKQN